MQIGLENAVITRHRELVERAELEAARRLRVDESRFLPPRHRLRAALGATRRTVGLLTRRRARDRVAADGRVGAHGTMRA
ncbi:hypothetical protein [Pengzhenrongella sp.]|jgi:hypothetical protein|uniref:hypothetical protein n=1 Tax=Pengzhenrongella sp. TaxID=2888820 RepID=UPI002F93593C